MAKEPRIEDRAPWWRLPGYREQRELGRGAFGRVVLAESEADGRLVAIKYLFGELLADAEFREAFRAEARLLADLASPFVVRLHAYAETDAAAEAGGTPPGAAIVMEFVDGAALRLLLREGGSLLPEAALSVLKGSLLGLALAHRHGIVHRDYKPDNVLVDTEGTSKIADFGIAVRSGDGSAGAAGTPPYMAPEQFTGAVPSPAGDVYAATAVFFECVTGHRPFQAADPSTVWSWAAAHRDQPIPAHEAPEAVRELVLHGLAKDPGLRPTQAAAFAAELEQAAVAGYGQDWERHGRAALAGALAVLVAAGVVTLLSGTGAGAGGGGATLTAPTGPSHPPAHPAPVGHGPSPPTTLRPPRKTVRRLGRRHRIRHWRPRGLRHALHGLGPVKTLSILGVTLATAAAVTVAARTDLFTGTPRSTVASAGTAPIGAAVDWINHTYRLTCDDLVKVPVAVTVRDGRRTVHGPGLDPGHDRWQVSIERIVHGALPDLGRVTAVLFYCSPQPSNYFEQELRVYRTSDAGPIGRIPDFAVDPGSPHAGLPPQYQPESLTVQNGRVSDEVRSYGPGDDHASGPHVLHHPAWRWDGQAFVLIDGAGTGTLPSATGGSATGSGGGPAPSPPPSSTSTGNGTGFTGTGGPGETTGSTAGGSGGGDGGSSITTSPPPPLTPPGVPKTVTASALDQFTIRVTWSTSSPAATGFTIDNGCPVGSCDPGATLTRTTGPATTADFTVTPGSYQCFRVQAFNGAGASAWSQYGCTTTPGLVLTGGHSWTDTGVDVAAGTELGLSASGTMTVDEGFPADPTGDQNCVPITVNPGTATAFVAPDLHCWALIARVGDGPPFEVDTRFTGIIPGSGRLYLVANGDSPSPYPGSWTVKIKKGGPA